MNKSIKIVLLLQMMGLLPTTCFYTCKFKMKCSHTSMNFSGTWIELKICHLENNLNTEHSQTHKKIKKQ